MLAKLSHESISHLGYCQKRNDFNGEGLALIKNRMGC